MPDEASDAPSDVPDASVATQISGRRTPERRGRTVVSAVFLLFSTMFIVWCTVDIAIGVFASDGEMASSAPPEAACATGVQSLATAVERALALRTPAPGRPAATLSTFDEALAPEWNESGPIEARCATSSRGARAYAAVSRFRTGAREAMHHDVELAPLRQEVAPYLVATASN